MAFVAPNAMFNSGLFAPQVLPLAPLASRTLVNPLGPVTLPQFGLPALQTVQLPQTQSQQALGTPVHIFHGTQPQVSAIPTQAPVIEVQAPVIEVPTTQLVTPALVPVVQTPEVQRSQRVQAPVTPDVKVDVDPVTGQVTITCGNVSIPISIGTLGVLASQNQAKPIECLAAIKQSQHQAQPVFASQPVKPIECLAAPSIHLAQPVLASIHSQALKQVEAALAAQNQDVCMAIDVPAQKSVHETAQQILAKQYQLIAQQIQEAQNSILRQQNDITQKLYAQQVSQQQQQQAANQIAEQQRLIAQQAQQIAEQQAQQRLTQSQLFPTMPSVQAHYQQPIVQQIPQIPQEPQVLPGVSLSADQIMQLVTLAQQNSQVAPVQQVQQPQQVQLTQPAPQQLGLAVDQFGQIIVVQQ